MAFYIIRENIVNVRADIVVNTVNPEAIIGGGTETAIYKAAGSEKLLEARKALGLLEPGNIGVTDAYALNAKYIIHASGPVWLGGDRGEEEVLRKCYDACLDKAAALNASSIVFPLMATGVYDFPKDKALRVAINSFSRFLENHDMEIILTVFDNESVVATEKLFSGLKQFVDDNYVEEVLDAEYACDMDYESYEAEDFSSAKSQAVRLNAAPQALPAHEAKSQPRAAKPKSGLLGGFSRGRDRLKNEEPVFESAFSVKEDPRPAPKASAWYSEIRNLKDIENKDIMTFGQYLQQLINKKGMKNADVYNKANVDKRYFSKLINDKIKPSKEKLMAIGIGLRLNLDEMNDFLNMAGFALTHCSKVDLVVEYHIVKGIYNINDLEIALYDMDLPSLCSY